MRPSGPWRPTTASSGGIPASGGGWRIRRCRRRRRRSGRLSPGRNAGRRTAASGVWLPPGGLSSGMHPPFSFPSCGKENGPCTVQKKRPLRRTPVQWPSARNGGRRIGACADFASPSGTLFSSTRSILPSRGGWCGGCRGGRRIASAPIFAAAGLAVDGSWCGGRMWASARKHKPPRPHRAARSEAERAERGAVQMRSCTPA